MWAQRTLCIGFVVRKKPEIRENSKENQQRKNKDNQSQVHLPLMFASVSFAKETQNIFHAEEMLILFQSPTQAQHSIRLSNTHEWLGVFRERNRMLLFSA